MSEAQTSTKYCFNCGEKIDPTVSFCPECGAEHKQSDESKEPVGGNKSKGGVKSGPTPSTLAYLSIWIGPIVVLLSPLDTASGIVGVIVGYIMTSVGVWIDSEYATKTAEQWDPDRKEYLLGTILLMVVAVPLYLYRRRKYV